MTYEYLVAEIEIAWEDKKLGELQDKVVVHGTEDSTDAELIERAEEEVGHDAIEAEVLDRWLTTEKVEDYEYVD